MSRGGAGFFKDLAISYELPQLAPRRTSQKHTASHHLRLFIAPTSGKVSPELMPRPRLSQLSDSATLLPHLACWWRGHVQKPDNMMDYQCHFFNPLTRLSNPSHYVTYPRVSIQTSTLVVMPPNRLVGPVSFTCSQSANLHSSLFPPSLFETRLAVSQTETRENVKDGVDQMGVS
ncbi:hypothetical protein BDN72DRAFT_131428 [Pluteus cervinus]|uniref:Uncharacterized protein n=1 Tax=Pluteus cervinus TaxID=181527 RepID=A0ACD3APB2_9AGAR|nr:hypothetical protein BDN72DRAFT_131428 [Pluteus cervinus]